MAKPQKSPEPANPSIAFIDLAAQQARLQPAIDEAIARVLSHGNYIMGPEIQTLEKALSAFCGARHSITCSNGTDALALILMALNVKPGQAVFVPTFTFAASAEVIPWLGAMPVFVDVDEKTYNICPSDLERAVDWARKQGLKPAGIITVDLFGLPADYDAIEKIAENNRLWILDDAAQGFGGRYKDRAIGTIGTATATSFFPAKPLGCYGDGGAIFTQDDELAKTLESLRVHGKGSDKYDNVRIGMNGRLDTLQAAILIEKLRIFEDELQARQKVAERYTKALAPHVQTPIMPTEHRCAWAQYTIALEERHDRAHLLDGLKQRGIPTAIYYPKPLHLQTAYRPYGRGGAQLPRAERLAEKVFSLPMHPYLSAQTQDYICENVISLLGTQ